MNMPATLLPAALPPVRVLIVDDSASMRMALTRILSADDEIEIVGAAPDPHVAREMIRELNPDVLTLDVEMPGMDGLSFLERIMRLRPMPVVMCSTLTNRGASIAIEALRLGAVDCIGKPSGDAASLMRGAATLCETVKNAGRSKVIRPPAARAALPARAQYRDVIIAIGASTGGVEALFELVRVLPSDAPPILVVQHMPAAFTTNFAARLDGESAARVIEASHGQPVLPGHVYIAPGGERHLTLVGGTGGTLSLKAGPTVTGHRPSVDVLFNSVAPLGNKAVGAILTGMGTDGATGLLEMHHAGARTFAQSRETCVVFGMPRAAIECGAVDHEVPLPALPEAILAACRLGS